MLCRGDPADIRTLAQAIQALGERKDIATDGFAAEIRQDGLLYVNWTPTGDLPASGALVHGFLQERGCSDFNVQLESGPGITLPPLPLSG